MIATRLKVRAQEPFIGGVSISSIGSATAGMAAAMQRLGNVASKAASGDIDVASQAVDLAEAKTQLRANAAVLRATNEMMGTLLDLSA